MKYSYIDNGTRVALVAPLPRHLAIVISAALGSPSFLFMEFEMFPLALTVRRLAHATALVGLSFASVSPAAASDCIVITELPTIITSAGHYCLDQNHAVNLESGEAVNVNTSNVVVDLGGYRIANLAGPQNTAAGVRTTKTLRNVTVRNGTIRAFGTGVGLPSAGSSNHLVEDLTVDSCRRMGIFMSGTGHTVRRSNVFNTGAPNGIYSRAIAVQGPHARIEDNEIRGVEHKGQAQSVGIYLNSRGGVMARNDISGVVATNASSAPIWLDDAALVRDNNVSGDGYAGVVWSALNSRPLCTGNHAIGYQSALQGCADGGGNVSFVP